LVDDAHRNTRLVILRGMGRDPRITRFARRWLQKGVLAGPGRAPFLLELFKLLAQTRDLRPAETLRELSQPEQRRATIARVGLRAWQPLKELATLHGELKPRTLGAEETKHLQAIAKCVLELGSKRQAQSSSMADVNALFSEVYADPTSNEAR